METNRKIFGTDGVRGRANVEPVTAETALKLGRAAGYVFKHLEAQPRGRGRHKIVIGKDTRLSGYMLENALSSGILSMGVDVLFIGPLPTPGVAYVTRSLRADAGIVITASHNPYTDNGIKFFRADGYKLDDKIEARVEGLVFSGEIEHIRPSADEIGKAVRIDDALGRYIEYAKASFPRGLTLEGLRIVVDAANGAAYKATPCVLRELGAEVFVFGNEPDGKKQANLSVERALEAWPYLMQTGRRLGSPAAVHADGAWMREFMTQAEARGYRVDFVCVHWYGGANAQSLVNRLRRIHEMYGRPIWLTEFAVADWQAESVEQNRHKPEAVLRFMKEILPQLDALDFVERYAWFSASEKDKALGNSALFKEDGSLTELGRCYAEHAYARGAEAAGGQKAAGMEAGERVP